MACIIVLGGHGTGTSAVAQILHHLGINMGTRLVPNRFEDWDLKNLFREVYHCRPANLDEPVANREGNNWGFKEPRLCEMLDKFTSVLERLSVKNRLIAVRRDIDATAKSITRMLKEEEWKPHRMLAEWQRKEMEKQLDTYYGPVYDVCYETLIKDPGVHVNSLASWVGVPVTENAIECIHESSPDIPEVKTPWLRLNNNENALQSHR